MEKICIRGIAYPARTIEQELDSITWGSPVPQGNGLYTVTGYYAGYDVATYYGWNGCGEAFEPYTEYSKADLNYLELLRDIEDSN